MTPHHITRHDMTWHDILQLTTLPRLTSPHNQPHYFISPRSQPHDIILHQITAHHITTTDTPRKRNQIPPKHHHQMERLKMAEGWRTQEYLFGASHWLVAVRTFYTQILSLAETSAPARQGTTWIFILMVFRIVIFLSDDGLNSQT